MLWNYQQKSVRMMPTIFKRESSEKASLTSLYSMHEQSIVLYILDGMSLTIKHRLSSCELNGSEKWPLPHTPSLQKSSMASMHPITFPASTMDLKIKECQSQTQLLNTSCGKENGSPFLKTANDDLECRHGCQKGSSQACKEVS